MAIPFEPVPAQPGTENDRLKEQAAFSSVQVGVDWYSKPGVNVFPWQRVGEAPEAGEWFGMVLFPLKSIGSW